MNKKLEKALENVGRCHIASDDLDIILKNIKALDVIQNKAVNIRIFESISRMTILKKYMSNEQGCDMYNEEIRYQTAELTVDEFILLKEVFNAGK